ncbi:MAG: carboxypeptidase-like regulatory domain-containing protein, partial [Bacteroidota bacterium]
SSLIPHSSSLYRWLCALAVYPKPEWSLTIAIGRALGMETNYDNLLILSRIPWLQTGDLTQRLRKELLSDLDLEAEKLARETVKQELEAVQPLIAGSHAGLQHQSQLAIQNFALDPTDPAAQEAIRQLLEQNLLTPREINDLNQAVSRIEPIQPQSQIAIQPASQPTIQQFLAENEPKPEPPMKPFFTKDFYRAAAATLAFLLIFIFAWTLGGTDRLYRWVFGEEPSASVANAERPMRDWFFVKERIFADSAVLYNNMGVDAYREVFEGGEPTERKAVIFDSAAQQHIFSNFRRAIEAGKNKDYPLAESNMSKVDFNAGVDKYNLYLQESRDTNFLHQASANFLNASLMYFDSTELDGMHGFGLAQFYLNQRDSALNAHQFLLESTGGQYFDTLSMFPHLESLLFPEKYEGRRTISVRVLDAKTAKPVTGVLVTAANFQGSTGRDGSFSVELREGERREFSFSRKGYRSLRQTLSAEDGAVTLSLQPLPEKAVTQPGTPQKFSFEGVVTDAKTGRPIPEVMIAVTDAERDGDYGSKFTDGRGRFTFELDNLPEKPFQ